MDIATVIAALIGGPTQHARLLRLHTTLGPNALVAETLTGTESVDDGGYRFELTALSPNAYIGLTDLLGAPALLQLLTAESRIDLRPFHGHVTGCERVGSNAGLARYKLTLEPWLSYLAQRTDHYIFRDMTVMDIVDDVFADYQPAGPEGEGSSALAPAWRWDLADPALYRRRSVTTQHGETDYAFINRLLAEEGLFYWFEHEGDIVGPTYGRHTLVIADHNGAFTPTDGPGQPIAYHRASATEQKDTIQHWHHNRRLRTAAVNHASWNYRNNRQAPVHAGTARPDPIQLTDHDPAGPYAWHDQTEGARRAAQHLDAANIDADTYSAASSVRNLAPGQRFVLTEHASWAALAAITADGTPAHPNNNPFICLRVQHHARNNLGADVESFAEQQLGKASGAPALPQAFRNNPNTGEQQPTASANNSTQGNQSADFYHNQLKAIAAATPYRPATAQGFGLRRQPVASAHGPQTAIVVGHSDRPIDTDRDHRVQVQYHWQRGNQSASGQSHPSDTDNAPAERAATGAWVRVASTLTGDNYGGVTVPRIGQEVLIDFIEGDIDRPIIVASVYNGQGNEDAPHNRVPHGGSKATGNAAAWFAGNAHNAVYSGIKTQTMADSQTGTGGYNLLRFDDTPSEAKLQLATTQHASGLHLGHLKAGQDNKRTNNRGYGAELATQQSGAIRAGAGLLLTTEAAHNQMAATMLQGVLGQSYSLTTSLTATAQNQQTQLPKEPEPKKLNVAQALEHTDEILSATDTGTEPAPGIGGGDGEVPRFGQPLLAISGVDGIGMVTPKTQVWVSGKQTSLTAAQDLSAIAQGNTTMAAAKGATLFTYGQASNGGRPVNQTGIALHAATGQVTLQATTGKADFNAEKQTTVASTDASLNASSPTKLTATASGAYLKIQGANIELGAPGPVSFKAAQKIVTGPMGAGPVKAPMAANDLKLCELKTQSADSAGEGMVTSEA